jgi:dynein intermediate chain
MSASDTRRRAEIEAKRAKLAELKRAREERSSRIAAGRAAGSGLVSEVRRPALRCRR